MTDTKTVNEMLDTLLSNIAEHYSNPTACAPADCLVCQEVVRRIRDAASPLPSASAVTDEEPNFAEIRDDFLAQHTVLNPDYRHPADTSDGTDAGHALNAFVGYLTHRFASRRGIVATPATRRAGDSA